MTHRVTRDGRELHRGTENECFVWLQRNQSSSVHRATTHEGYAIEPVPTCTCWVRTLPPEESFAVRCGAHSPNCPIYRPSRDPVDRERDEALYREHGHAGESAIRNGC